MDVRFATGWQAPDAAVDGSKRCGFTWWRDCSTIVLGGRRGRLWPSAARMAYQLRREGYDVVFVEVEHS